MGTVSDVSGRVLTLAGRTVIGRSRSCGIRVTAAQVSAEHACIFWHRSRWWIRDLGSTNGTWIEGARLEPGERRELAASAAIRLGAAEGPPTLVLVDVAPPAVRAIEASTGAVLVGQEDFLQLPDEEQPEWTIYAEGTEWVAEHDGAARRITDGEVLDAGDRSFRIVLPVQAADASIETTDAEELGAMPLELCSLRFAVSPDEEHVAITVSSCGQERALKSRAFQYLLLTLARRRLDDRARGASAGEEGWMYADELAKLLASNRQKINLDVCRARQQLAAAGIAGAARIVERRATTGQIRIGASDIAVTRTDDD